jgi:hypothetical protein
VRQLRELAQRPDHRVQWVGDADDKAVGGFCLDALADRLHHLKVDFQKIVAAHPRPSRNAGGDDAHVRALYVGIVGRALERRVEAVDGAGLGDVERLAFRCPLGNVEQDDVAKLTHCGEVSQGSADHPGADQGNLLASHEVLRSFRFAASAPMDPEPRELAAL